MGGVAGWVAGRRQPCDRAPGRSHLVCTGRNLVSRTRVLVSFLCAGHATGGGWREVVGNTSGGTEATWSLFVRNGEEN